MTVPEIVNEVASTRTQRVLSWLYAQEPAETERFRLSRVLDVVVMPSNVQAFLRMLLGEQDDEQLFTPAECEHLVSEAHSLCARYLLTPNAFLVDFLDTDHGASVVDKLAALTDYPYYGEFLFEWFRVNGANSDRDARRAFVRHTEYLALSNASVEQIATYLQPVHGFFQERFSEEGVLAVLIHAIVTDKGIEPAALADHSVNDLHALAVFIKSNIRPLEVPKPPEAVTEPVVAELPDEERYKAFLDELRQAGVHLPLPTHMRHSEEQQSNNMPPISLFISNKLRKQTIDDLFHGNTFEYQRLVSMIDAAVGYEDALLNLETVIHLQKAEHTPKLLVKWASVIRMKFQGSETHAVR
ncbi:MAG: hypothetical protein JSS75_13065 [Bacteroidetes bacterium]|nr:hypothetical protein [Bacteroidota bacterium]